MKLLTVIVPEKLHPLDTTAIGTPYGADGAAVPVQKFRDEFKFLTAMEDDSMVYLLLGLRIRQRSSMQCP